MIELNEQELGIVSGADMDEVYIVAGATLLAGLVGGPGLAAVVLVQGISWASVH